MLERAIDIEDVAVCCLQWSLLVFPLLTDQYHTFLLSLPGFGVWASLEQDNLFTLKKVHFSF